MSDTLSKLADKYPSLPSPVIFKTALLSLGVRFDSLLIEAGKTALPDFRPYQMKDGTSIQVPYIMVLEGGSAVRLRCREDSPFTMISDGETFRLTDDGESVASFTFAGRPAWHGKTSADGTPLDNCGLNQHGDMMILNIAPACEYWTTPWENHVSPKDSRRETHRCGFCGYGLPDDRSRALGQEIGIPGVPQAVLNRAAEAVDIGMGAGARHLYLTGGAMVKPSLETDRYLGIVTGMREASRGAYLAVGSQALLPNRLSEFKRAGADGICFNLEIWNRDVWERVCPGKARFFGRDMWEESLVEGVRVFGEGNVYSAFVIGAEMVLDGAFADPKDALRSNLEGARWLLERGIDPILSLFWPFVGTDMESATGPDLHYLLRLYTEVDAIRKELNRPFSDNMACRRCLYMQVEGDFD